MTITTDPGNSSTLRVEVAAGATSAPIACSRETVVVALPGAGGTLRAEATWSLQSAVTAGTANWGAWDAGNVTSRTSQLLYNATAVRFVAATEAGVGEVAR